MKCQSDRYWQKGDTKGDLFERLLSRRHRSLKKQTLVANEPTGRNAPEADGGLGRGILAAREPEAAVCNLRYPDLPECFGWALSFGRSVSDAGSSA